jgi:RNA polymerase sporulation-specific sigma factor
LNKTDEELIQKYREGNLGCMDKLISRYLSYVRSKARSYFLIGGEQEDLVQEGMIGLFKAIRDFDARKNAHFKTFAMLCVSRQLASAIKQSNRFKNMPLNTYVSFYQDYGDDLKVLDSFEGGELSPEQILIDRENSDALIKAINDKLSQLEKKVLYKYIQGLSYSQIANELVISKKTIDNALQRIKKKLSLKNKDNNNQQ